VPRIAHFTAYTIRTYISGLDNLDQVPAPLYQPGTAFVQYNIYGTVLYNIFRTEIKPGKQPDTRLIIITRFNNKVVGLWPLHAAGTKFVTASPQKRLLNRHLDTKVV
jgi:hypothetical protein